MRVSVLVGGSIGVAVAVVYTLCVMEEREWFGNATWVVAAPLKHSRGYNPAWWVAIVWSIIPAIFGGLLGDEELSRRILRPAAIGAVSVAVAAVLLSWWTMSGRPGFTDRMIANTLGTIAIDGLFAGAFLGTKIANRMQPNPP